LTLSVSFDVPLFPLFLFLLDLLVLPAVVLPPLPDLVSFVLPVLVVLDLEASDVDLSDLSADLVATLLDCFVEIYVDVVESESRVLAVVTDDADLVSDVTAVLVFLLALDDMTSSVSVGAI